MSYITPQERHATPHQAPGHDEAASSPGSSHEIKYRLDAARYVAAMLTELRQIAGKAGFDKLVTAVDAAYYEAYAAQDAQQNSPSQPRAGEDGEKDSRSMEQSNG